MIRFCDKEVGSIEFSTLSRKELLEYFRAGHEEDILCVYDSFEDMEYMGIITLRSVERSINLSGAIVGDYVILDQDIWENARHYFLHYDYFGFERYALLPVLNENGQLVCFAYEDGEANREIRQIRELSEKPEALQFQDIYPEYKCVIIHEFNELACFLAKYLESQGIAVQFVGGDIWQIFFIGNECQFPEYECLNIYAEGVVAKSCNWKERLLRSVSVEFECIDKIYEANIKEGKISDDEGRSIEDLLERLKYEKEIIIFGTGREAQSAYDYLAGKGLEVCNFIGNYNECTHKLFGKKIITQSEARCTYKNAIFIDCVSKHSAWGMGNVDYYDYIGYKRNDKFILLRDYVEVPENNLLNVLKNTNVVLTGDIYLCSRLSEYFIKNQITVLGYLRIMEEDIEQVDLQEVSEDSVCEDTMCLLVIPKYISYIRDRWIGEEEKERSIRYLLEKNFNNYTDYFCDMRSFINVEKINDDKYTQEYLKPKRIVLGSIESGSGNEFFRSLLDSHPEILNIYYSELDGNLFWICVRLSTQDTANILPLFWKFMEGDRRIFDREAFNEKMGQLLARKSRFTSQELFVMFHIAYCYMDMTDMTDSYINDRIIYWEPHHVGRGCLEDCVEWLAEEDKVQCDIINVVRNSIMRSGHRLKLPIVQSWGVKGAYSIALECRSIEKKVYAGSNRLIVRFEDLKCNPQEILIGICDKWDIKWSDMLLQTTHRGKEVSCVDQVHAVTGFDLQPVYNVYENFYSEFDRFRIMLFSTPWQKKYGYPYVELENFTRRELQEMILKEFRFESPGDTTGFYKERLSLDDRIILQIGLRAKLQEIRCNLMLLSVGDFSRRV